MQQTYARNEPQPDDGMELDYGGRLARAYEAGYHCANERELQQVCGVSFAR